MEFSIEFYETGSGKCPVRDFLDELKESDSGAFAALMAGLAKLRNRNYHRPPLSKAIGNDLYELRHVGKVNIRVLYFFTKNRRIILVHGTVKKMRVLPIRDRQIALERKRDWLARNSS